MHMKPIEVDVILSLCAKEETEAERDQVDYLRLNLGFADVESYPPPFPPPPPHPPPPPPPPPARRYPVQPSGHLRYHHMVKA